MRTIWSLPADADLAGPPSHWFQSVLLQIPQHMIDTTLLITWRAWYERNEATHDKPLPTTEGSKRFLNSYLRLIRDVKDIPTDVLIKGKQPVVDVGTLHVPRQKKQGQFKIWTRPPAGWMKLSIDGSYHAADHSAGTGIALRDEEGRLIFTACWFLDDCVSPLEAELRACMEGLELSHQFSQLPIIVETDCAQLVEVVSSSTQDRSALLHLISDIKNLSSCDRLCKFVKVERSQVRVSHCLANFARTERRTVMWLGFGSEDVLQVLDHDRLVTLPA
jgi:ribonuclease HI